MSGCLFQMAIVLPANSARAVADKGRAKTRDNDGGATTMTIDIDTYMAKAHAALDEAYADALKQGIASLSEHGEPTEEERQAFIGWYTQLLDTDRANNLAKLRSWLEREGETLQ